MLSKLEQEQVHQALCNAKRPFFYYDDDPDGLSSYLLLRRFTKKGDAILVKSVSRIDEGWAQKSIVKNPDKVFVLDVPEITVGFVDTLHLPLYWIDHHKPIQLSNVYYYNPRLKDSTVYYPTSALAYEITKPKKDAWIALVGCFGDWYLPSFLEEHRQQYEDLLGSSNDLGTLVYHSRFGELVRIFSFLLKGEQRTVQKCIRQLLSVQTPYELLEQQTATGKALYERYKLINEEYVLLLHTAKQQASDNPLLVFMYTEKKWSFTADLANELSYLFPEKVIIIARLKGDEYKCSLRSKNIIEPHLQKSLEGLQGQGGGHPRACGATIHKQDWNTFLERFQQCFR